MRLLCVEDDRVNAMLLEQSCLGAGVTELEIAECGRDALVVAARWRPDLLVLDMHLPDTDGFALLASLRALLQAPDLPAVLCSADTPDSLREPASTAGFLRLWSKPVTADEVRATLAVLRTAS
jgi:CheY-like chemotaxis protein